MFKAGWLHGGDYVQVDEVYWDKDLQAFECYAYAEEKEGSY